jgi:lipopolysaccharide transport system permease protein
MGKMQPNYYLKMFERVHKVYLSLDILWNMSVQQLRAKYAGSKLGIWWAVILPLLLAVSINFIFNIVFKIDIPNYTFFVLAGLIPWTFSMNALGEVTNSFTVNSPLLKQAIFPKEFIPLSSILSNLLSFLIGLSFLLVLFVIFNPKILILLPMLFLVILLNSLFIVGLGLFFSVCNMFFKDLSHFLTIGFTAWFWITPVFYSLKMVDFPYRWVCLLNPMTYYVVSYQKILFEASSPGASNMSNAFLLSIVSVSLGYLFFVKKEAALLKNI